MKVFFEGNGIEIRPDNQIDIAYLEKIFAIDSQTKEKGIFLEVKRVINTLDMRLGEIDSIRLSGRKDNEEK